MKVLQETLHHDFQDIALLELALTHRSTRKSNNERLEFLGDAILSYVIAEMLFHRFPDMQEGELSRLRSSLVKGESLAVLAREFQIGTHLHLGPGEIKSGGQDRDSILADAMEAIIGAIYLDAGIDAVKKSVLSWYDDAFVNGILASDVQKDAKSTLQEWLQARQYPLPTYEVEVTGKSHEQTFYVTCRVEGLPHETQGESTSRRKAEQIAAGAYLQLLDKK